MSDDNAGGSANDGIEVTTNLTPDNVPDSAPKPKQPVEPVEHDEDDDDDSSDHGSKEKKKSGWTRQRDRLRADNAAKDRMIADLQAKLNPAKPASQEAVKPDAEVKGRPDIKDFTDVLDYLKADGEWVAKENAKQAVEDFKKSQKDEAETNAKTKAYEEKVTSYNERLQPILDEVPDFSERVQSLIDQGLVTANVENAVLDSPKGEMVTLYLLANPQELQSMQQMSEAQTYRAIALIEAKIGQSLDNSPAEPTVAVKQTKAAAPITPIGKKAVTSTKSPADMSQEEWEAHAAKLKGRR